ncbi:type II toxin-antitoxin system VapC family toxin [Lacunimicrobium album]
MNILVDANILVRLAKQDDADHLAAIKVLEDIQRRGHRPAVVPQCIYEFYVVATRPLVNNGLGLTNSRVDQDIADILLTFVLLPDVPAIFEKWREITSGHRVLGKTAHDARIVAAMLVHGIQHLVTFNCTDFNRYSALISVQDPRQGGYPW